MSRFTDVTMVAVQVETDRTDVWVEDGRSPASYPVDGQPLRDLLAMPPDTAIMPVTNPIVGWGTFPIVKQDDAISGVVVTTSGSGSNQVVTNVEEKTSRTIGPTVMQTKYPTPVSPGDKVSFTGRFAIRTSGNIQKNSDGNNTFMAVRVSLWGMSSQTDEYGVVEESSVELLAYETQIQTAVPTITQNLITLPATTPATVPEGISGLHLTVGLIANRPSSAFVPQTREPHSAAYDFPFRFFERYYPTKNFFTHAADNPLRLTVVPKTPPTPGAPAAKWETLTQEQTRLHRYTYEDITDYVNEIVTEKIEADLGIQSIRFIHNTIPAKVVAGKRIRILALRPGGSFTVIASGLVRTRRVVEDGRHQSQVEIGVHDSHGRLGSTVAGVAFDTFAEYAPVLNRLGVPTVIDGDDVTGPARDLPPWGGLEPSYRDDRLSVLDALVMTRNTRKGSIRLNRHDHLEVLSALPSTVAMDVSDVPGEGDASFAVNAEFGIDTADLVNQVAVDEHLMDSEDFDRTTSSEDPPISFGYMESRTQTAEYRRAAAMEAYGLAAKSFRVVRGSGKLTDIEAGDYGGSFAGWAAAILDEYSVERSGPKAITIPVTTAAQRALVSQLEVLDAIVVRFRGVSYVRRIRRVKHTIRPGRWSVELRFDITGDQTYWLPDTPVPLITLGDTDAGTIINPSAGLVDGGHPSDTETYVLDGGTL